MRELADHLDDAIAELRAGGLSERGATSEALKRVGDPKTVASAFRELRPKRQLRPTLGGVRSPAWLAVVVMSLVTALAAELPQASGAKASVRPARSRLPAPVAKAQLQRRSVPAHRVRPRGRG